MRAAFAKSRVPVHATFDGEPYDGSLVRMGTPCYILDVRKDIRARIGKQPGATIHVTLRARVAGSVHLPDQRRFCASAADPQLAMATSV